MARIGGPIGFIGRVLGHLGRFVVGEVTESLRLVGALLTAVVLVPMVIGTIVLGRWSATGHFGRALTTEVRAAGGSLVRMGITLPGQLLMVTPVAEGIGQRLPAVVRAAPGRDTPTKRTGQFDGYEIVGSLKGGGSGGKLYIAEPDEVRRAGFERQGHAKVGRVVIKVFSLKDGSSLPQIVRESRALDAAKKLGLVLDHELTHERFYYVMRYVPGDSLGLVTQRLHATSKADGLDERHLRQGLGFVRDLLETLSVYHSGGLWHKDVKPDNIIVDGDSAHLVDLGLVTPLRSAMTLTTHGTEYFRDPELVRMALKGVKVHQVDGAKFDIYAAGAVLFSVVENSFPAHGGLSQVTRRCPDTVRWIIRRSMTDYDKRYASVAEMLADLRVVMTADDPFAVKPAQLPSVSGDEVEDLEPQHDEAIFGPSGPFVGIASGFARTPRPEAVGAAAAGHRARPKLTVKNWWTGKYQVDEPASGPAPGGRAQHAAAGVSGRRVVQPGHRMSAAEQLERARGRAAAARERAQARRLGSRPAPGKAPEANSGVAIALVGLLVLVAGGSAAFVALNWDDKPAVVVSDAPGIEGPASMPEAQSEATLAVAGDPTGESPAALIGPSLPPSPQNPSPRPPQSATSALGPVPGASAFLARLTGTGLDAVLADRVVLVISELVPPLDPDAERFVREAIVRVASTGLGVVGDPLDRPGDAGGTIRELQAGAIVVRRQRSLREDELFRDMASWIEKTQGVNYVLWIEPNADDPASPRLQLFHRQPTGVDAGAMTEAMLNGLVRQLIFPSGD